MDITHQSIAVGSYHLFNTAIGSDVIAYSLDREIISILCFWKVRLIASNGLSYHGMTIKVTLSGIGRK